MFKSIKLWISLAIITTLVSTGWFAWKYYNETQVEIRRMIENEAKLEVIIETNKATLEELNKERLRQEKFLEDLNKALNDAESPLQELNKLLSRHNLTNLALEKPGLIERRINDATFEVFRDIECTTGNCVR